MNPPPHDNVWTELRLCDGAYVLDALAPAERREFEAAMTGSAELAREVRALEVAVLALALAVVPVHPSARLRRGVFDAVVPSGRGGESGDGVGQAR